MAFCRVFLELHSGLPSCSKFQRVECKFKSGRKLRLNPISILEDLKKSQENRRHLRTMAVMKVCNDSLACLVSLRRMPNFKKINCTSFSATKKGFKNLQHR